MVSEGQHFGEISTLYKCSRTATIVSRLYNTIAKLTYLRFRMISSDYPQFKDFMMESVFKYRDPKKEFILNMIKTVPFIAE